MTNLRPWGMIFSLSASVPAYAGEPAAPERVVLALQLPYYTADNPADGERTNTWLGLSGTGTVWLTDLPGGARVGLGAEIAAAGEILGGLEVHAGLVDVNVETAELNQLRAWADVGFGGLRRINNPFCMWGPCDPKVTDGSPVAAIGLGARWMGDSERHRWHLGLTGHAQGLLLLDSPSMGTATSLQIGLCLGL